MFSARLLRAGGKQIAWSVFLLPYIEQENIYRRFHFDKSFNAPRKQRRHASSHFHVSLPEHEPVGAGRAGGVTVNNTQARACDGMGCTDYGGMYGWSDQPGEATA